MATQNVRTTPSKTPLMYHFRCPECEYSDEEAGSLATESQRYCGLCAGDTGRDVRLIRWIATESEATR